MRPATNAPARKPTLPAVRMPPMAPGDSPSWRTANNSSTAWAIMLNMFRDPVQALIGRKYLLPNTYRNPSAICRRIDGRGPSSVTGGGSGLRMLNRDATDTT
jgi:hypothetical protein